MEGRSTLPHYKRSQKSMSKKENDVLLEDLIEYLSENYSYTLDHVHSDERGYFVRVMEEVGHPSENGSGSADIKKYYLPVKFQELNI